MSKDSTVPDEAKLAGSSNLHLWKYMITRIAKKEKLWSILFGSPATSSKKPLESADPKTPSDPKESEESEDERFERLMYIMSMSIKPSLLVQLTEYQERRSLWNFLCHSFEVDNDSRKFDLKNRLAMLSFSKTTGVEAYFSQFRQNLAQLSAIRVKIDDADLVQIVMKALPDSYDYFLQNFTSGGRFPTLDQL